MNRCLTPRHPQIEHGLKSILDRSGQTYRLNLHETLTSRVATKSEQILDTPLEVSGVFKLGNVGANANISHAT